MTSQGVTKRCTQRIRQELSDLPLHLATKTRADLTTERNGLRSRIATLEETLTDRREQAARVADLIGKEAELAHRLAEAEAAERTAGLQLAALEQLADDSTAEFAVVQPATPPPQPTTSNRKSLAAMTFGGIMGLGLVGLVGHAWLTGPRAGRRGPCCGLPVLAAAGRPGNNEAEARQLALRLRDPLRQTGKVALFASASGAEVEDVAVQLGRLCGLLGESVVILDARTAAGAGDDLTRRLEALATAERMVRSPAGVVVSAARTPAGLVPYLTTQEADVSRCILPTPLPTLHYVPAGGVLPNADLLASASMHDLLGRLTERFDRVLVLGPGLDDALACEILAGYAESIAVGFRRDGETTEAHEDAVEALRQAGPPWVGAIVRS